VAQVVICNNIKMLLRQLNNLTLTGTFGPPECSGLARVRPDCAPAFTLRVTENNLVLAVDV
jgi:hypothetical protein